MFPCEDSKTVSVCPYPEKINHHSFVNISPTLVIDTSMERSSRVLHHENQKKLIFFLNACLSVPAVMFYKHCLAYIVHIDCCNNAIHKHSCRFQHIYVLTTCTYMTTSGMHRRLSEGRHKQLEE